MTTIPEKVVHTWLDGVGNIWQLDDAGIFWIRDDVTGDMVEEVVTFGIGNEIGRLVAENKRLREALERVRGFCDPEPWPNGPPITLRHLHDIADAALKETTDD